MASVYDEVYLHRAYQRIVKKVQYGADVVGAVRHERVERGEHHERDAEHVAHDVDEQLSLKRTRHRCATFADVQVGQSCGGHGEPAAGRRRQRRN